MAWTKIEVLPSPNSPSMKGEPGERVESLGGEATLVGPSIKSGIYLPGVQEGETILIRFPSTFLPEALKERIKLLRALNENPEQAMSSWLSKHPSMLNKHENEGLEQFVGMLYDAEGNAKPSGYPALLRLKERLLEWEDGLVNNLSQFANEIVKRREEGRPEEVGFVDCVKSAIATLRAVRGRLNSLDMVLNAFEAKGKAPAMWDAINSKHRFSRTPFEVKLDGIQKIVTDPEQLEKLRYNTELYREAAKKEGLHFEEPADALRKDTKKTFLTASAVPSPKTPKNGDVF